MSTRRFLNAPEPLAQQVAEFIRKNQAEETLLVTPTAGATRQIIHSLKAAGLKAPTAKQPMQALLPQRDDIASAVEQSLAWSEVLQESPQQVRQALFWKRQPENLAERLKAGRNLCKLSNSLAEAGLSPSTLCLPSQLKGGFEEERWSALANLHRNYLEILKSWSLADPNQLRLDSAESPNPNIRHLVIAGVPDLPSIFAHFCERLEAHGATVDILIWNPSGAEEGSFDTWGRPDPTVWTRREIPICDEQLHVAASTRDEAQAAVTQLLESPSASLVSADTNLHAALAGEILNRRHQPYLPEGEPLIRSEAAKLALGWDEFRLSKDLRLLRRLVELPAFCRALDTENPISQSDALGAVDHLLGETIASTLDTAWAASPPLPEEAKARDRQTRAQVRRLLGAVRSRQNSTAVELLEAAFPEEDRPKSVERVIELARKLGDSPALSQSKAVPTQVFIQAILGEQLQAPSPDGAVTLNGWLEAPWLDEDRLILCGMTEGQIPQSLDGDPFLPDSLRPALGLNHNDMRLARDAYLLSSLLASRSADQIKLSFSKFNNDGDPNRASRLLLRTPLTELPGRVQKITTPAATSRDRPRRQTAWKWQLPVELPKVEKISPTQFERYLACPFRFCLDTVLKLDSGPEASREMNAAVFGNLIHRTLENFARAIIPLQEKMLKFGEQEIRQQVQQLLKEEALDLFGPEPAPAVRVQLANAATRLHAFARIQAECFAEGWMILAAERKLEADAADALKIGELKLSGVIDRVDRHSESGALRVMDYKTFSKSSGPMDKHLGPMSHNWLPEAEIELPTGKAKNWTNLQLPLYRKILEHWYPQETAAHRPETAYFVLPSDPNESGVYTFDELNEDGVYASALNCAETVAGDIAKGVFWPPQPFRGSWDDPLAPLLVNGTIEDAIHPDSIARLKGDKTRNANETTT